MPDTQAKVPAVSAAGTFTLLLTFYACFLTKRYAVGILSINGTYSPYKLTEDIPFDTTVVPDCPVT